MQLPPKKEEIFSDPEPVSFAGDFLGEISSDNSTEPLGVASEEENLRFDQRHRLDFEGLLYLGYLTDDFVWMGHRFKIRTITTNEYLEVALLQSKYKDTIGDIRAYTAAVVAACVESVDGHPMPMPLDRMAQSNSLSYRYQYVIDHWYPWIIDALYERFQLLEGRVEKVLEAMGKV